MFYLLFMCRNVNCEKLSTGNFVVIAGQYWLTRKDVSVNMTQLSFPVAGVFRANLYHLRQGNRQILGRLGQAHGERLPDCKFCQQTNQNCSPCTTWRPGSQELSHILYTQEDHPSKEKWSSGHNLAAKTEEPKCEWSQVFVLSQRRETTKQRQRTTYISQD